MLNLKVFIMKNVFVANKTSYGLEFFDECDSLDELQRAIVAHEFRFESYSPAMYTEELFLKLSSDYALYKVQLHEDEMIEWHEYDGQSWFKVVKKKSPKILSIIERLDGEL
jgi:hypothetical protein